MAYMKKNWHLKTKIKVIIPTWQRGFRPMFWIQIVFKSIFTQPYQSHGPLGIKTWVPYERNFGSALIKKTSSCVGRGTQTNRFGNWRSQLCAQLERGRSMDRGCDEVKILLDNQVWEYILNKRPKNIQTILVFNSLQAPENPMANCEIQQIVKSKILSHLQFKTCTSLSEMMYIR